MENDDSDRTRDGFTIYSDGRRENGLKTKSTIKEKPTDDFDTMFDVIVIGAGFTGLVSARELSQRGFKVLIIESRDRIGGRTMTGKVENEKFELGGTWIHWSQPHVWAELTRYGLSVTETQGTWPQQMHVLLDNGKRLKVFSMKELWPKICKAMNEFHNVDGLFGRTVLPLPHSALAAFDKVEKFDCLSIKDRLDQMNEFFSDDPDLKQLMDAYLSQNAQTVVDEASFLDHLRWWALGDFESERLFDKTSRFKISEGTTALARSILHDCRDVRLAFSSKVVSIENNREENLLVRTSDGKTFRSRTVVCTVPLNVVSQIHFEPPLNKDKQRVLNQGQCRGGTKFSAKLEKPIGSWFGLGANPNPITQAFTDDEQGSIIIGFGPDNLLDVNDINVVQAELQKFIPDVKVQFVFGHDWRNDPNSCGTWSWFPPNVTSNNLRALQQHEKPIFFASSDTSNGWRGFIDGAIDSALATSHQVLQYLNESNKSVST